jgi:hypothetical protein
VRSRAVGVAESIGKRHHPGQAWVAQGDWMELISGSRVSAVREREGGMGGRHNSEGKAYYSKYVMGAQANWAG